MLQGEEGSESFGEGGGFVCEDLAESRDCIVDRHVVVTVVYVRECERF